MNSNVQQAVLVGDNGLDQGFYSERLRNAIDKIYIREHYKAMVLKLGLALPTATSFHITGTPGMGKSLFAVYLAHQIINGKVQIDSSIRSLQLRQVTKSGGVRTFFFFKDNTTGWHPADGPEQLGTPDISIDDCSASAGGSGLGVPGLGVLPTTAARNIVVTSPRGVS